MGITILEILSIQEARHLPKMFEFQNIFVLLFLPDCLYLVYHVDFECQPSDGQKVSASGRQKINGERLFKSIC